MEEIHKALNLKSELDLLRPLSIEQENRIMQKFRLDWNYHSNHLEGNTLTYGETKALILFGITAQGKPLKDTLEITGHNEAIDWVIDMVKDERPLTENFIRELHKMLLREPYEKKAISSEGLPTSRKINVGTYKTTPNHVLTVTGETFYFASPEETPAKMYDLIEWYKEKKGNPETNPILLASEFHYKFIRIHPFDDGNGRTARILMNFILMQYNFPPVIIRTEDKENYFAVLRMADAGNLEAFVNYIAQNLNRSLEIMIAGAKGEKIEEEDDLDKEIALLEQRLNSINVNDYLHKKNNNRKSAINEFIIPLLKNFFDNISKFQKLFHKCFFRIDIAGKQYVGGKEIIENISNDSEFKNLSGFSVNFLFINLKSFDGINTDFMSRLNFYFKDEYCSITGSDKNKYDLYYDLDNNQFSLDEIIQDESLIIKKRIEQKISEQESKS